MAKNPSQVGANAIWEWSVKTNQLVPGNSRYGPNCMKVSQAPVPYSPGPITTKSYKNQGGGGIAMGKNGMK